MNEISRNEILNLLADLDEETTIHDPQTADGQQALDRIRGEIEELESQLDELNHIFYF